ncbi:MAG: bifunctional [glutamate--ammonia ligase]-adenylyl-L-tyrosine phosphorylase/[glutamate--ammonia-ligase] adenylyltransferase [Gammaproteobacteria bacterium]
MNVEVDPQELPPALQKLADDWVSAHVGSPSLDGDTQYLRSLRRVLACSSYLSDILARYPDALIELRADGRLDSSLKADELGRVFATQVPPKLTEVQCLERLRFLRHRELLRIVWRDINGQTDVPETLADLSALADAAICSALVWSQSSLAETYGTPRLENGDTAEIMILGMGKLGGRELNFSSDVDLIFLYTDQGETDGPRQVSNEQYFRSLAQSVINLLSKQTPEGFVYRVDVRLRPFGESGPLAVSLPAFESYLLTHGRDWERYAYVKARVINPCRGICELEDEVLRPFVYRRYLDYGVFASLREMKGMIEAEGQRREYSANLKLGPGGIREVEFITQSLQLVRGGPVTELRDRQLQRVLPKLVNHQCLPAEVADELLVAYRFLRRAENFLQAIEDRQTHDLPADELDRTRLAFAMDAPDWEAFLNRCTAQRDIVAGHFRNIVFRTGDQADSEPEVDALASVWSGAADEAGQTATLENAGFDDGESVRQSVQALRDSGLYRRMDESGRQRMDSLMPKLMQAAGRQEKPDRALAGALQVVEAIGRRSAYFALLNENPAALQRLTALCGLGDFLVGQLAAHPLLLDELLDQRVFNDPPARDELAEDLQSRLQAAGTDDDERRYYALVNFQQAATFRVAVADLSGALPLMKVSDRLTDIAELVLGEALALAWHELVSKHGEPFCEVAGQQRPARFAIVAYGKLGGFELGYGSDLDLVFLHNSTGTVEQTNGERPLDNAVFFARLTRRIISVLTLSTTSGQLYEVDTRLRPSGRSGMLVSSLTAFDRYQREDAWTWEHQALLRSRAVAGDPTVCSAFEDLRRLALMEYVKLDSLRKEVTDMRAKMRAELSRGDAGNFDLKQDKGGIADIEFLVQYLVLQHAPNYPDLLEFSDNIRQLQALARNGLLDKADEGLLADAYRDYRRRMHRRVLGGDQGLAPRADVADQAERVVSIWQREFKNKEDNAN